MGQNILLYLLHMGPLLFEMHILGEAFEEQVTSLEMCFALGF